jgi:hypothetical protein
MAVLYRDGRVAPEEYRVRRAPETWSAGHDHPAWAAAGELAWGPDEYLTRFRALWTPAALHLRFDATDREPWHTLTRHDDPLWEEEVVEVFVDPLRTGRDYAELEISPANVVCDVRMRRPWPDAEADLSWHIPGLETYVIHRADGSGWVACAMVPFAALVSLSPGTVSAVPPATGDRWRFNVFRIKRPGGSGAPERGAIYAAWSTPPGPSFHDPSWFRDLVFL